MRGLNAEIDGVQLTVVGQASLAEGVPAVEHDRAGSERLLEAEQTAEEAGA